MNIFETIGTLGTILVIGFVILQIALIKAIFEIRNATQHTDAVISAIAKKQHNIVIKETEERRDDDYQLLG